MATELKYRTVLSTLKKGEKPTYRAVPISNGTVSDRALYSSTAGNTGVKAELIKYATELLGSSLARIIADGKNTVIDNLLATTLSIKGVFDSANEAFNKAKHRICVNIHPRGTLADACVDLVGVNVTEGNRIRITSVLDAVSKTEGVITGGTNVEVFAAGSTFLIDTTAEDEGVWLEAQDGTIVSFGTVTGSTATTCDCTFATLPEPGDYKFVIASRGGLGKDYGVSIGRKNVKVVAGE